MRDQPPAPPQPPRDRYEWAVDALVEACSLLNQGQGEKAHEVIRQALWNAAGSCNI